MTKRELQAIRNNKLRKQDLNLMIECNVTVTNIKPGEMKTYEGQIILCNVYSLRVGSGGLIGKVVPEIYPNVSSIEVNDVLHIFGVAEIKGFKSYGRSINTFNLVSVASWELIGTMDEVDAKITEVSEEVDLGAKILQRKKYKPRRKKVEEEIA